MKLDRIYTLKEIASLLNCEFVGEANHQITGCNEIHRVERGDIVFVDHPKYYDIALNSAATTILIDKKVDCSEGKGLLISDSPFDDFNKLTKHFMPKKHVDKLVNTKKIHTSAIIYPNVFIDENVEIEENVVIYPNASILSNTIIKKDSIIGPGAIIGFDAFYYKKKKDGFNRLLSSGGVVIEERVEIGANCTIDKGVSSNTVIGAGSKLDNAVHIGHDTIVGKSCLFAAQVGIAGCVQIEDNVTLWGQVGCASDVNIGKGAVVFAQSGISKDVQAGTTVFGSPASDYKEKFKELAALRALPEFMKKK